MFVVSKVKEALFSTSDVCICGRKSVTVIHPFVVYQSDSTISFASLGITLGLS